MSTSLDLAVRGTTAHTGPGRADRLRSGSRAAALWVTAAAVILVTAIGGFFLSILDEETSALHPESVQPSGTKALMDILRERGVEVTVTESRQEARTAAAAADTTVLYIDLDADGETETRKEIGEAVRSGGNSLVLADPGYDVEDFTPALRMASYFESDVQHELLQPDCQAPAAAAAGQVRGADGFYSAAPGYEGAVTTCYTFPGVPPGAGAYARAEADGADVTVLGSQTWMTNASLDEEGHAALTLHTLGQHENLVVYLPQAGDQPSAGEEEPPNALTFVPPWFGVALLWLIPLTAALLWWRIRRFGPLAVERLPVVVPPVETVHGRAALMQRAGARTASLHSLRTASLLRIAARLARPSQERPEQLCAAIAAHTGRDLAEVRYAYLEGVPANDRQLSDIAVLITAIESEVSPT